MSVTVNGVTADAMRCPSPEVVAMRELLHQRALAAGLLRAGDGDEAAIAAALEHLLAQEVRVPAPTETECRYG